MTPRRFILFPVLLLFLFLSMYTWNQRTGFLDSLSTSTGLELVGSMLKPMVGVQSELKSFWERYLDLVGVREENERLKADLIAIQSQLIQAGEDRAELLRLRALLSLPGDRTWRPVGARVLAGRLGPNSALETVILSRGYLTGAAPGTPIMTNLGLVGRVLRASAHSATALLMTDPGSRIAVLSQETRTSGILTGRGARHALEMRFVARNATVRVGELLVTSGLDGVYPKGLPVARVVSVAPSDYSQFMAVLAAPLVDVEHLEEVLLLEPTGLPPLPEQAAEEPAGTPVPEPAKVEESPAPQGQGARQPGGTAPVTVPARRVSSAVTPTAPTAPVPSVSPAAPLPQAPQLSAPARGTDTNREAGTPRRATPAPVVTEGQSPAEADTPRGAPRFIRIQP